MGRPLRYTLLIAAGLAASCAAVRGPEELANAPVRWILRSPLHGMLSSRILLLELTDLKSGAPFVIPVNYVRSGELLLCGSDFSWWRNLEAEPRVRVELAGEPPRAGRAEIVRDAGAVAAGFRVLRPRSWESALEKNAVLIEIALEDGAAR